MKFTSVEVNIFIIQDNEKFYNFFGCAHSISQGCFYIAVIDKTVLEQVLVMSAHKCCSRKLRHKYGRSHDFEHYLLSILELTTNCFRVVAYIFKLCRMIIKSKHNNLYKILNAHLDANKHYILRVFEFFF